jgi:hypothetical protein
MHEVASCAALVSHNLAIPYDSFHMGTLSSGDEDALEFSEPALQSSDKTTEFNIFGRLLS